MASAVAEPVQGAREKGPVSLELLRMATVPTPDPSPLATLPSPRHPQAHETHGSGFVLCCEVAGREQRAPNWGACAGGCLH